MKQNKIERIFAHEILDSRGNPTVETFVFLEDGSCGSASVPSGASTGKYEAHEMRDNDFTRYKGKGVLHAIENVNGVIAKELHGLPCTIAQVDTRMIHLDGTENKTKLGANAMLSVSLACAHAAASSYKMSLYRYFGGIAAKTLPIPMMNILNGGAHASNNLDIQEFMILPIGFGTFSAALRAGVEIYHTLGSLLKKDGHVTTVGDEGGFAPNLKSANEALDYIVAAIREAGYSTTQIGIALDIASSEWHDGTSYKLPKTKQSFKTDELIAEWENTITRYPIVSIEDGLGEDDHAGWQKMTATLGDKILLVGDDYFVTNPKKLCRGIEEKCANAILVKPNQIGTLSEVIEVVSMAQKNGYKTILSHRSGETADTTIADLAVALNTGLIKTGAPARAERCEKYNRLLRIEKELQSDAVYGGSILFKNFGK